MKLSINENNDSAEKLLQANKAKSEDNMTFAATSF
jgi:hypothetical protein